MVQRKCQKCNSFIENSFYLLIVLIFSSLTPEEINWHLLQLCLLRDYIDLEFRPVKVKEKSTKLHFTKEISFRRN